MLSIRSPRFGALAGISQAAWQFAGANLFDQEAKAFVSADRAHKAGEQVYVNYGADKLDSQLALDMGFTDPFRPQPGFLLQLSIPADDRFADDKNDVLEVAGVPAAPDFRLRVAAPPPEDLKTFLRRDLSRACSCAPQTVDARLSVQAPECAVRG